MVLNPPGAVFRSPHPSGAFFVLGPSDWCSVEVKDSNRRLKICEIFRAVKFLDLLAHMRAIVERSDLSRLFRAVRKQREQKGFMETTDLCLTCH